jgi:oxygen-dependent protoporphyrinogen oxidase
MGRLVTTLVDALGTAGVDLRDDALASAVAATGASVRLSTGEAIACDGVVVATPARVAGALLDGASPRAAAQLRAITTASVALVTLAFPRDRIDHALDGSGYLVPRVEGRLLTACSWASSKWAHLAGDGTTALLRASAGRAGDERWAGLDDHTLVARLVDDLAATMRVAGEPSEVRVDRWHGAFPQYQPGHLDRVAAIEADLSASCPRVAVTGASFRGLGVPACIRQGRAAAAALLTRC